MEIALLWIEPSRHIRKSYTGCRTGQVTYDYSIGLMVDIDYYAGCDDPTRQYLHGSGSWIRNLPELRGGQHPAGHTHRLQQSGTSIFSSSGQQQVEFVHESVPEYDLQFFQLSDEWNGCDSATTGPSVTVSTFPSLVPVSDAPSYVETTISSQYATSSMISMEQFQGLPEYGDCFTVDRTFQDTSANPYTGCRTGQVTYDYSIDSWLTLTTMRAVMIPPPIPARFRFMDTEPAELRGGQHPAGHTHRLQQSGTSIFSSSGQQQVGLVPVSDAPSYVETTISSQYATSSMISMEQFQGLPEYGDCFTVDRTFQDTSANPYTGCRTGQVTYDYSIGLMVDIDYYAAVMIPPPIPARFRFMDTEPARAARWTAPSRSHS
ncbi:expressed unknown protein [Seminavis robusta]|uniref:Uncharacterized protein n=1 Tax=Seminavis robusta TaxID=568900 RepID=A0A9N8D8V7_9STRA|nr:expressed unknown protein [Seminavis robusta]|eukprot:Sro34_g021970.1 n/a (376) ;mRNA; r:72812-74056